jgi:hypothetical protein
VKCSLARRVSRGMRFPEEPRCSFADRQEWRRSGYASASERAHSTLKRDANTQLTSCHENRDDAVV